MSPNLEFEGSAFSDKLVVLPSLPPKNASSHKVEIMDGMNAPAVHLGHLDFNVILIKLRVISVSSHSCTTPNIFHLSSSFFSLRPASFVSAESKISNCFSVASPYLSLIQFPFSVP